MRKYHQQQILRLIKTLEKAQSASLYADCYECVLQISEFIESVENDGIQTLILLEEYCVLLSKTINGDIGKEQLHKHLIKVENSVKYDLKSNRIEIAFISYKASMSDSIESIYLAAKADPNCDVFWIPVPYYDKQPDGSFGKMHFEGPDYYNDNIECTDWCTYDIEERYPDVIFTFNPYDNRNYVTSIYPSFYCERMRNYTSMLCYVPYFVRDDLPEHFVTTAGCIYAHKVIVQSMKIRDIYIRIFKDKFGSGLGNSESKFLALGSPKFDKVINTKREDYTLPDEWYGLIDDKKVVLYNTTLEAILNGNEHYLKKLYSTLDIFCTKNDFVLWWRPHPLTEATLSSMRPHLLYEYKQIIMDYKQNGFGIYDDTPDLHRAIAWSDAYYGDRNSVFTLYQITGKPIMVQNLNENTLDFENYITVVDEYYSNKNFNMKRKNHNTDICCGQSIYNHIKCQILSD